ncbi:MAG: diaminopimelate epimerase [Rhodospirillales bacterium]
MSELPFIKMHGLGNDFVVIDARNGALDLSDAQVRAIADRHTGVGCDQLIVIEPARSALADVFMRIRNADGGEVEACGNATRCVAAVLMDEKKANHAIIETVAGLLDAESSRNAAGRLISVDMGPAKLDWREIPLREACDTLHVPLALGPLRDPVATNIGNPHATFFVPDAAAIALSELGPKLEHDAIFPARANIEVAQITGDNQIRLRVWERGAGITLACGSGACATVVASARRGLTGRKAEVTLDGGRLTIEWLPDNHVLMTGPVAISFSGNLDRSLLV